MPITSGATTAPASMISSVSSRTAHNAPGRGRPVRVRRTLTQPAAAKWSETRGNGVTTVRASLTNTAHTSAIAQAVSSTLLIYNPALRG